MNLPQRLPADAISQFDQWAEAVFDDSSLGMLRVSLDQKVVAGNRTAAAICGLRTLEGMSIGDLLVDQKNLELFRSQAEQRMQGLSTEYEVEVFHFPDRRRVPVKVSGMPIISSAGDILGSLAIIRSLELERRVKSFEDAIHAAQGVTGIFQAVCEQAHQLLDFDFACFNIYSKTGKHSRMLRSYDPEQLVKTYKRWYPISDALAQWTQRREVQSLSFADFVSKYPELEGEPTIGAFLTSGYVRLLRYPVVRGGRVVASFTCATRKHDALHDAQVELVKALPIAEACLMTLHSLENDELLFRSDLIREMFICRTPKKIADAAVKRLATQFGWESVEIYSIVEASQRIKLLSQWTASPEYHLEECYSQPVAKGVLGYVCQNDRDVRIDDIGRDLQFKDLYLPLGRATRSELCMPIRVNGRISALLNIEDQRENAFSEEEQENVRNLLDEIGGLFGAAWNEALISSAFELTPSAVLIADKTGNIIQHNSAALAMLGISAGELTGTPVNLYFEQPEIADDLFKASQVAGVETRLKRRDGSVVQVLLGSRELDGFGAWVISARDLTYQKRIAELESLRHMYSEIAAQTKTPLSLACSWLQRLQRKRELCEPEMASVLQKALVQLKKVNMTYERLALYSQDTGMAGYHEILLHAGHLITRILETFPGELVSAQGLAGNDVYIRGDPFEIGFAIESTLSYLLRFLPEDDTVKLAVSCEAGRLLVKIEAPFPPEPGCPERAEVAPEAVCQTIREMALGSEIIERFMQHHHGSFRQERVGSGRIRFQLDFPTATVEA